MLIKEICKRCCDERADPSKALYTMAPWRNWDEFNWIDEKKVYCRTKYNHIAHVDNVPPEWCPYVLEHLMKAQKNVE